jgi:hypothetical protein
MSDTFEEKLAELRKKHPGSLTDADREFLHARRSYLLPHELISFGMAESAEEAEEEAAAETPAKPARRPKKTAEEAE